VDKQIEIAKKLIAGSISPEKVLSELTDEREIHP